MREPFIKNPTRLQLTLPMKYVAKLRRMAAQKNFKNFKKVTSASKIAREILEDYLNRI